ncbi:MAG: exonuclease SbcCD subunit D [Clostridia bacterium]|nr:exonuclease SbcCD subunit D [Clostridia bacterium]
MRFLHLSDLHIGRRMNGFSLLEDQAHVLDQALELAGQADAVLLAGDLYDKAQPSAEAIRMMSGFLVRLSRLGKPVFAISGNHDSPEQVAYCRELLGECGVWMSPAFDGELSHHVLQDEWGEVRVWLMPFIRPASVKPYFAQVKTYEDAVRAALSTAQRNPAARHVLVAHQYVSGADVCESEMRLIGGLDQISLSVFDGFDYVALGHLHSPQQMAQGRVCYAGSPLKYSLSEENQHKSALMVELGEKGQRTVSKHPFRPLRDVRTVTGRLADVAAPEKYSEDYVYAMLTDEELLLDPLGALRLTYPRLIGMRIRNSRSNEEAALVENADSENLTPMEHFVRFYALQNHDTSPDEARMKVMQQIIEKAEEMSHAPDHP